MELLSPSIVLASYAEPLLDGRRAVVFGDSTSPLAEEMIERGARSVHVCDPEPARAGEAAARNRSRQISIVPLDDADVAVRQGAFDVAIVEDLSNASNAGALLAEVRRALSVRGVAFIASPNPDAKRPLVPRTSGSTAATALGYYELYDKVVAEFPEVRMLGQTPFVGYAIVDFAPTTDLDVELDSGFLPTGAEEPEWFVAVAARGPVERGRSWNR
jgi:SAM-dependent methyltransferase